MEIAIEKGVLKSQQLSLDVYYPIGKITFPERLQKMSYRPRHMFFSVAPKKVPNIVRTSWEQRDVTSEDVPIFYYMQRHGKFHTDVLRTSPVDV